MPPETRQEFQLSPQSPAILVDGVERRALLSGLFELTKPRLSFLSVVTTLVGYLAARPERDGWILLNLLCGTALAAGGAAALNQWMERRTDALMRRTKDRPIPSGQVTAAQAFIWGVALSVLGTGQLFLSVGSLASVFAAATILTYILLYTPLKRRTRWATEVGAISGALPPLIGWAAARGTIDGLGWSLFALLFFWQIPHFLAIAWTYRRDYEAADFPMLPVVDADGRSTAWWSLINTVILAGATVVPAVLGQTGWLFGGAAVVLGAVFIVFAMAMLRADERNGAARRLFFYSIFYLPALLAVLVVDRWLA
jgi:protoheme IX farnesyltransferase